MNPSEFIGTIIAFCIPLLLLLFIYSDIKKSNAEEKLLLKKLKKLTVKTDDLVKILRGLEFKIGHLYQEESSKIIASYLGRRNAFQFNFIRLDNQQIILYDVSSDNKWKELKIKL